MTMEDRSGVPEETLDPQDWQAFRELAHRMVDDALTYLETVRERPAWQPVPEAVRRRFQEPLPAGPQGAEQAYQDFLEHVLPYPLGNIHPRFWGWVIGTGSPLSAMAEMLAAAMNPNVAGPEQGANYVEAQVLDWCKEMLGYPSEASGLLVDGGSMANVLGLAVARNVRSEFDLRRRGLCASPRPMVLYASREVHSSVQKAAELLGLGSEALRLIPVNAEFEMNVDALETAIAADRAAGAHPFCVVGCAGTVNTGAFDDLERLADLCRREGMWFHVDGAFGALAALAPDLRPLVRGMERADSVAFDLHKWLYMPYEAGCILVRSEEEHRHAFSLVPDYLAHGTGRGLAGGSTWWTEYGPQLSRGFRALKVWMSIKAHGIDTFRRLIQQNVDQARTLAALVDREPELERLAPAPLNIVCFRYAAPGLDEARLNALNAELLAEIQERGIAVPSNVIIGGKAGLRVAITNHRSRREDFELLVREAVRLGGEMAAGEGPGSRL